MSSQAAVPTADDKKRELDLKEREVAAREREVTAKERENGDRWRSPVVLGLFAAALGLAGNTVVAWLNGQNSQNVERAHAQSTLIVEAIKSGDNVKTCQNLRFFVSLNLLDDPQGTIRRICEKTPEGIPSLPLSSGPAHVNYLNGNVADAETHAPIAGARVKSMGVWAQEQITTQDGNWSMTLPSVLEGSEIELLVEKKGYETAHFSSVITQKPIEMVLKRNNR